jgi:Flp pilus assembly secretin CpaC
VSDALTADPLVDASEITVQVEEGHVTLTGTVVAREQKRRAEDVAERISGVSDVSNNLRVNKADYTKAEERRDPAHIVTPSVVAPEGQKR